MEFGFHRHGSPKKTYIRRIKKKKLMSPSHVIKYGRSNHVKVLVKQMDEKNAANSTIRFCQNVWDYLICNIWITNGLHASNILQFRVEHANEAEESIDYHGYFTFTNSCYKTSTICGEKAVADLRKLFGHLKIYVEKLQPVQNRSFNEYSFVPNNAEKMRHGAIGSAMTGSFERIDVFNKSEYPRVFPTRI